MCEIFQVFLDFKEVYISGISEDFESKDVEMSLEFLGYKISSTEEDNFILIDGAHLIKQSFVLKSEICQENEENFMFQAFGCPVKIQLISKKLEVKSKRKSQIFEILFADGSINLFQNLKDLREKCKEIHHVILNVQNSENTEVRLTYEIKFENASQIESTLFIKIDEIFNFPINQDELSEAAFQFPFDQKFQAVFMQKVTSTSKCGNKSYLMDDLLKENNFEIDYNSSEINFGYENFQTNFGTDLLHDMILNNQKMIIELKFNGKFYMTSLDLTIFNHPDVTDVNFLVPIYEWSDKLINDKFTQKACYAVNETAIAKKKISKKSMNKVDSFVAEDVLTPIIIDGKYTALNVNLKLSKPFRQEQTLESLLDELNVKFPYKLEIKQDDFLIQQSQKDFHCIIHQISNVLDNFMDTHSNVKDEELMDNLNKFVDSNEFCLKNDFKEVLTKIIGNTFNREEKTRTNYEFKLLMMKAFKSLNQQMNSILIERYQKNLDDPKVYLDEKVRKWQIEEYIGHNKLNKAEELIDRELSDNFDETKMREKAFYLLKLKKYEELEVMLKKLFRISRYCSFSLYILAYLSLQKENYEMTIFLFTILTKLKPQSMEYWILLLNLYKRIGNIPGVKFCSLKIQGTKFIPNYRLNDSVIYPEIILMDSITNILWHQFKFAVPKFYEITKIYAENTNQNTEWQFDRIYIDIIELIESKKYQEGLDILKEISIDDENEITLRILKGNILYEIQDEWKAVCEYEIAFNLCHEFRLPFPLIPALRAGFFSYCSDNFGTFDSLMGLERALEANLIDPNSSENWTLLALTSCKLKKFDIALNCYLTAKKFNADETPELIKVEKYLDI